MKRILLLASLGFFSCNQEPSKSERVDAFLKEVNDDYQKVIDDLPPGTTIDGVDTGMAKLIIDSTSAIYNQLGRAELIDSDLYVGKCNRYMLTYRLYKKVKDSSDLINIVKHLGYKWHLQNTRSKEQRCQYVPMTSLFLYPSNEKEFYGAWVAMIAFNPDHPNGETSLSSNWKSK